MSSQLTDSLGRIFDPKKFKDAKDKLGRWINARAGRKSTKKSPAKKTPSPSPMETTTETPAATETPAPVANETTPPPAPAAEAAPSFADIEAAAKSGATPSAEGEPAALIESGAKGTPTAETVIGIIQTALVLIGEEEGVLTDTEKMILRPPLERVLKKYKVGDDVLPPEVDLAIGLAGLVIVRLQKPKTSRWAAKIRAWVVNMWFGHKGREIQRIVTREASQ